MNKKFNFWFTMTVFAFIGLAIGAIAITGTYNINLDADSLAKLNADVNASGLTQDQFISGKIADNYKVSSLAEKQKLVLIEYQTFVGRGNITQIKTLYNYMKNVNDQYR